MDAQQDRQPTYDPEPGEWLTTREWKREKKIERIAHATEMFRRYERLLKLGHGASLAQRTFAGGDGATYSVTETLRACERDIRAGIKGTGPGLQAAERDLRLIECSLHQDPLKS